MDERHMGLGKKSRRAWLRQIARAGLVIPALGLPGLSELVTGSQRGAPPPSAGGSPFSKRDEDFLDEVGAACFKNFLGPAQSATGRGIRRSRAPNPLGGAEPNILVNV